MYTIDTYTDKTEQLVENKNKNTLFFSMSLSLKSTNK